MNNEVKELIKEIKGFGRSTGYFTMTTMERDLLLDYINLLEINRDQLSKWLEENRKCYIYQDSLGEDYYFEDLDIFDELKGLLEKGKEND